MLPVRKNPTKQQAIEFAKQLERKGERLYEWCERQGIVGSFIEGRYKHLGWNGRAKHNRRLANKYKKKSILLYYATIKWMTVQADRRNRNVGIRQYVTPSEVSTS